MMTTTEVDDICLNDCEGIQRVVSLSDDTIDGKPNGESKVEATIERKDTFRVESRYQLNAKYARKTSTETVSKLWRMIESIDWQKSVEDLHQSMATKMFDLFNIKPNEKRLKEMIDNAIDDQLIVVEESTDHQFRYSANFDRKAFGDSTNDWICFSCHSVRETEGLIDCKTCFRAFHLLCLKSENKSMKGFDENDFKCTYCRLLTESVDTSKVNRISKSELNKCLSLLINNLEFSFDPEMFVKYAIDLNEKSKILVFREMDLISIKHKAMTELYDRLQELINDFKHFVHNYMVCVESKFKQSFDEISKFEKRFNHEISELKLCVDCYQFSSDMKYDNDTDPNDWFTLVCDPPHELVFAKLDKYPMWPSKVIAIRPDHKYDVRFFDPPEFSRALIPIDKLRPIGDNVWEDDEDLELPKQLLEKHMDRIKAKGLDLTQTVKPWTPRGPAKKRRNSGTDGCELKAKRKKKSFN